MKHQKRVAKDGTVGYYVRIHVGGGKYETVGTYRRKRDADAAYEDAKARLRGGQPTRLQSADFTTFTENWLQTLTVRESTLADYKNTCKALCEHFGRKQLQAITPKDCREFIKQYGETRSPRTVRKAATRLKQVFGIAVAEGYLQKSPAAKLTNLPRPSSAREIEVLEPHQIGTLTDAMPEYWRPLIQVAVRTGLRRGELFGLRWSDIHWERKVIRVKNQLSADGSLTELKTESAQRNVPIGQTVIDVLKAHKAVCPESDLDLVFPTPSGKPVHHGNFYRAVWKPARKKAGFTDLRLHDLRHTFASLLIHNRESVKYVQTVMGHADAQTTMNVYGHLFEQSGEEAVSRLEDVLSGAS